MVSNGRKVVVLPFNTSIELVLQDTSILGAESHPLHLHGFNFFDPNKDPVNFNPVDHVERNIVGVPEGDCAATCFISDNPGVWFIHCHLEVHTRWRLRMAWIDWD
ncbi:Cupredoxin [Corchorus olitorius]|uniref:Cupredoxin n=1 Tax=Corchorus olitorius TaxID=93759 RepID=A0A1R3GQT1_9ROSI|nr:Cupredoxin [Corchorus olitorius]